MRRIMMVTEPAYGGVVNFVTQLCNLLCDSFEVHWAHTRLAGDDSRHIDPRVRQTEIELTRELTDIPKVVASVRNLRQAAEAIRPDIIHLHSSIAGGLGRLAFRGEGCPVVYTPHGYAHILMGDCPKAKMYQCMEYLLGRTPAVTLTCCESEDEVARGLCKRTAYIETGINIDELDSELKDIEPRASDRFTVFMLGRVCRQKRPELFNQIAELVPEARFVWIGSGEEEDKLTAPNIEVTGWKPRAEALALAKGADAFVLCSYGEAIAMSLLENMYLRKLCLVSDTMGNKSVIKDGVNGYVCDSAGDYAERIRQAMLDFPSGLTQRAYQDILDVYNTTEMKRKYIEFYSSL